MEKFRLFEDQWEDACHRKWYPAEMNDSHLENTIAMLENNSDAYLSRYIDYLTKSLQGISITRDMTISINKDIEKLVNADSLRWVRTTPIYKALKAEIVRRQEADEREAVNKMIQEAFTSKCKVCAKGQAVASMNDLKALAKQLDENEKAGLCKIMKAIVEGKYKVTPCGQIFEL